jgi:hypothetical protein
VVTQRTSPENRAHADRDPPDGDTQQPRRRKMPQFMDGLRDLHAPVCKRRFDCSDALLDVGCAMDDAIVLRRTHGCLSFASLGAAGDTRQANPRASFAQDCDLHDDPEANVSGSPDMLSSSVAIA